MVVVINSELDPCYDGSLPFRTDLLCPLKGDQGHLEIMRGFLKRGLLVGLRRL